MSDEESRDYVAQAYLGERGDGPSIAKLRARVDWMVSRVESGPVLDLGCSEGIVSCLLARKGFDVVGVDPNKDAIDFAVDLASRPEFVDASGAHPEFLCGTLDDMPEEKEFETLICGEVIEHLSDPAELLDGALQKVTLNGTVIITTPMGVHPHPDHQQVYTMSKFLEHLPSGIELDVLDVADGYIRCVGKKVARASSVPSAADLLLMTERALIEFQENHYSQVGNLKKRIEKLKKKGGGPSLGKTFSKVFRGKKRS